MKFGGKEFSDYWAIIKIPTLVLIAWAVLGFIFSIISFSLYQTIFSSVAGWILTIAVFSFIGWTTVKDHKGTVGIAAWGGALSGVIAGFIGAIIAILMFYFVPAFSQLAIAQATAQGADVAMVRNFMAIGIFIGLITGPLINGLVGAAISAIAGLIAKKT